jgi:uncharacterized membrane protein
MVSTIRTLLLASVALLLFVPSASAGSFVYVAVPAAECAAASPCAPPELHVYDAETARLVTRLPLPVHTAPAGIAMSPDGSRTMLSVLCDLRGEP